MIGNEAHTTEEDGKLMALRIWLITADVSVEIVSNVIVFVSLVLPVKLNAEICIIFHHIVEKSLYH